MRFTSALLKTNVARGKPKPIKVNHPPYITMHMPAGQASPAPPIGPIIGSRGINVQNFCKEFNRKTAHILEGTPLPTVVSVKPDRTFELDISTPTDVWLVFRAAGIRRGAERKDDVVGMITRKHLYEIVKIKSQDTYNKGVPLEILCQKLIERCFLMGVRIVDHIDPDEYRKFLESRKDVIKKQLDVHAEKKAQKMLRSG